MCNHGESTSLTFNFDGITPFALAPRDMYSCECKLISSQDIKSSSVKVTSSDFYSGYYSTITDPSLREWHYEPVTMYESNNFEFNNGLYALGAVVILSSSPQNNYPNDTYLFQVTLYNNTKGVFCVDNTYK